MRLKQYSKKQPCYYCGVPGPSSREHAPPNMMFTSFDCDSITVPSCDEHNTEKGVGDRAITTAIIMSASQMPKHADQLSVHLTPNVLTAIKIAEPDFRQAKNETELRRLLIDPPEGLDIPLPHTGAAVNLGGWIRQLTAAMVWSVTGKHEPNIKWDDSWAWSPGYMRSDGPVSAEEAAAHFQQNQEMEEQLNQMVWLPGWSAMPKKYPDDIYSFELCFLDDPENFGDKNIMFRHRFYNNTSVWYVWFNAPVEIIRALSTSTQEYAHAMGAG